MKHAINTDFNTDRELIYSLSFLTHQAKLLKTSNAPIQIARMHGLKIITKALHDEIQGRVYSTNSFSRETLREIQMAQLAAYEWINEIDEMVDNTSVTDRMLREYLLTGIKCLERHSEIHEDAIDD